jgi:hypothetical protein
MKIIQHALDNFPSEYKKRDVKDQGPRVYDEKIYSKLGLN